MEILFISCGLFSKIKSHMLLHNTKSSSSLSLLNAHHIGSHPFHAAANNETMMQVFMVINVAGFSESSDVKAPEANDH